MCSTVILEANNIKDKYILLCSSVFFHMKPVNDDTRLYDVQSKSLPLLAIPLGLLPLSPLGVVVRGEVLHLCSGNVTTHAVFVMPSLAPP